MVAVSAHHYAEARGMLERAIALDSETAEYHAQYARCLALLNRGPEALAAVERSVRLGPRDALTFDTLGVVLSRLGEHARAAALFGEAARRTPGNPGFRYNLAASLRFLGRFDEAEEAYEAAIRIAPAFHRAHSALAELRTQTAERNHVARLLELLPRVGDDVDGELHLRHALAKEYEDLGDFDAAFAHLAEGQSKKRRRLGYSIAEDRALFDAVQALFDRRRLDAAAGGDPGAAPIFVVGMPRSGTTLVERILSSHSDVSSAGESQSFGICVKRAAGTRSNRVLDVETLERGAGADFAALGKAYLESARPGGPETRFVDKMPLNFLYVGFIHLALPNARIVCLQRHPLDTCLSNFRQLFALKFSYYRYAYDLADIGRYYVLFDRLMRHWERVLPGKILHVRYEALVEDQRAETRRLLDYCGVAWQDACLAFQDNAAPVATASAVQVRSPLYSTSIGRWRRYAGKLGPLKAQLLADGIAVDEYPG